MSGDKPYYNLAIPQPLNSFAQEKIGMIELDSLDGTAVVAHGDICVEDGFLFTSLNNDNVPSLSFKDSYTNISSTNVSLNGSLVFNNSSLTSSLSFNSSFLNISASNVSLNGNLVFNNVSTTSMLGVNYSEAVPTSALSWYQPGGLYLSPVNNTHGQLVYSLCVMR